MSDETMYLNSVKCKRCSMEELLSVEEIKAKIPEYLETLDEDIKTDATEYAARLELCSACDGLVFGVTCKYCGCFVQMRALNKNRDCPNPSKKLW